MMSRHRNGSAVTDVFGLCGNCRVAIQPETTALLNRFPLADQLWMVNDFQEHLRVNVDSGTTATDSSLLYATGDGHDDTVPLITEVVYANKFAGAVSTTAYYSDTSSEADDKSWLATSSVPNRGELRTVATSGKVRRQRRPRRATCVCVYARRLKGKLAGAAA
ncbi:DUF4394 domain-containing protein [Adhaeretor mobilis]|uniref:DUF4394 domain-containing protein n=1 Tax=Adhaeretor mobilis TaxID=1930276 RepID=A0A517MQ82_9BACT|nr:DUF4394 domain-containing protein [Adhaeretor mobilis]QDS97034.1 hypothetical protein HG15A2_02930 [Adhaeretor mobilis]